MSREIIAIDIDDVLSSQVETLIAFSNERYSTSLTTEDFKAPGEYWGYYEKLLGINDEEGARRFSEFIAEMGPLKQIVSDEARAAIKQLKTSYDLDIVTSRGPDYQEGTLSWLQEHVPGVFRDVHFVDLWHESSQKATKAKICQEIGAGYLIDDNAEHCNLSAEAGVSALLFGEWGWSISKPTHPNVTRVVGWREVLKYFDERNR